MQAAGSPPLLTRRVVALEVRRHQLRFDLHLTGYQLAAREAGTGEVGAPVSDHREDQDQAVQIVDLDRDEGDEEDFLRTAVGVLRAIDAGVSYPIRGWMCRSCPFSPSCRT